MIQLSILLCQVEKADRSLTVSSDNQGAVSVPLALVEGNVIYLFVDYWKLDIPGEVEQVDVALVVDGREEGRVARIPAHIIDIILGMLEGSQGLCGVGRPELDGPVEGAG